jgi:hypothetical protein
MTVVLASTMFILFRESPGADDLTDLREPKSLAAKKSKTTFFDALQKLDDEHATKLKKIREQYYRELDEARKSALEKNDLDEAQRILAAKASAQEEEKAEEIPVRGFKVLYARWGARGSWSDVTLPVRRLVKSSKLVIVPEHAGFPDPIVGTFKSLVVVYSVNGRVGLVTAAHDHLTEVPLPIRRR